MTDPPACGTLVDVKWTTQQFDRLYRGFQRSNPSLDGRVLVAVRTTGIYCLPSCRARKPKRENVRFYLSRDAAERDGFRACRRCRPEVHGGSRALERAAVRRWLDALATSESGIEFLARANGSSPSRLYRMFYRQLGHGPRRARGEVRLRRACELLYANRASITRVAYDAGFGSLATFYRWFRRATGRTPTEWRRLVRRARGPRPALALNPQEISTLGRKR
ncbi:MAG TPA: Ada metal-binding domain-containing protein [Candidatus Acidoferrales bacterium]|nr:Ada metal-binding domain-containing protein [Candidatus Acidoferrales bacterium]